MAVNLSCLQFNKQALNDIFAFVLAFRIDIPKMFHEYVHILY